MDIPDAGARLELPAGETAAARKWKKFVENGLDDYAKTATDPIWTPPAECRHTCKFGTIHPRTMAVDLGGGDGPQAYLRELAFRDFYAAVLDEWPHSAWWNLNTTFDEIEVDDDRDAKRLSRRGRPAGPGSRSSTPGCASSPKPASCTTGCG